MLWKCWFQNNNLYSKHTKNSKKKKYLYFFFHTNAYTLLCPLFKLVTILIDSFHTATTIKELWLIDSFFFNVNNRNPFKLFLMSSADLEVQLVQLNHSQLASNIIITLFWGYFKVITLVTVNQCWHNVGFSMLVLITIKQHRGNVLLSTLFI